MAARCSDSGSERASSSAAAHTDVQTLECNQRELIAKVRTLRQELADWHIAAGQQVSTYTTQLNDLQAELLEEMSSLKCEVTQMKSKVRAALETSNAMATVPRIISIASASAKGAQPLNQSSGDFKAQETAIGAPGGMVGNENEGPQGGIEPAGASGAAPSGCLVAEVGGKSSGGVQAVFDNELC